MARRARQDVARVRTMVESQVVLPRPAPPLFRRGLLNRLGYLLLPRQRRQVRWAPELAKTTTPPGRSRSARMGSTRTPSTAAGLVRGTAVSRSGSVPNDHGEKR